MLTLVIETATAACSVALIADGAIVAARHEVVGRGHAERLLPMIAELPGGGRAGHILVDVGPGSFTGIRVGIAAARGLALGWHAGISGYSSLALIAAAGFTAEPDSESLAVVLEGGHGEVFMQPFVARPLAPIAPLASLRPEAALAALGDRVAIGNGIRFLTTIAPGINARETLPRASDALLLPPSFSLLDPTPIYGRAPDATPIAAQ
ncbi:tRNA (adenosine(37)-N6)-threonylcarbamoyltransferase complex dimerization subunit type 1 TsaB [Sphingomonas sp. RT2P30]|uniref:tRNA (adenosine(37)-N6)-threonylcarbamoyltransferase complex dimerization subunit type 1 TsaB n=1 Tax=Parasphingomonas halimpatiens TaxID=3096162 RepID=UPI002FC73034